MLVNDEVFSISDDDLTLDTTSDFYNIESDILLWWQQRLKVKNLKDSLSDINKDSEDENNKNDNEF